MEIELAKKLEEIDSSLYLKVYTNNNIVTIEVASTEIGTLYSYSSTDILEVYSKVKRYIDCLEDVDEFDKLIEEITLTPIGG